MDSEEVDIGTVRDLEASSWVPPHFDAARLPPNITSHRRLSSPSAPDLAENLHVNHSPTSGPTRVRSFSHLRNAIVPSNSGLPTLDDDKIARIRRWIFCIAVVDFDLDIGPVLDRVYPAMQLSTACRENIAFSSFPDSAVFEIGSQAHSFRLSGSEGFPKPNDQSALSSENGFIYGYAYFVQRRDSTSKRGYLQRSIVILSHLALPSLFEELVSIISPLYLSNGNPMLESACDNISEWPNPGAGALLELGFLGFVLRAQLPHNTDELQYPEAARIEGGVRRIILASLPSTNLSPLVILSACLPSIWSIWELLILCEPIIIFGISPRITSLAVWWLRDFIRPITVAGDFRPYMTIHDQDYTALINKNPPKAGLVVGVTNPFVLSVTKHWPHVLSLGWEGKEQPSALKTTKFSRDMPGSGPPPGFVSHSHKRYTSKDRPLLKVWEDALKTRVKLDDASQQLRRHFASRTASFLVPLNRYLNSLIPSPTETSSRTPNSEPRLKPFNTAQFLASLKAHGTPLPFRSSSKQRDFYERWLRTPAFALWLAGQQEIVTGVLKNELVVRPD